MNDILKMVTDAIVLNSKEILCDNLTGIYLHGSAVMGCYNEQKSDIDLLVVINGAMDITDKVRYTLMVTVLNSLAPKKGLELSVVLKSLCKPYIYPTPFELHFSNMHLEWYKRDPYDYAKRMNGTDKDLAAHMKIIYHRGLCLYGEKIHDVFEDVGDIYYFDSIWHDIANAQKDILSSPVYTTLNLCRVLAFKREKLILSKQEGGKWALVNVPKTYSKLIKAALDDYASNCTMEIDETRARDFAKYMIAAIKSNKLA